MDVTLEKFKDKNSLLTGDEGVKVLWEWRKYRNQVFWNSMYRWGAAVLLLTIIPYLLPDLIRKLESAIFIFPVLACLSSIFAAYLMIVQYMLYKLVDRKYRSLLGSFDPGDIPEKPINRIFRISIGKIVAGVFIVFGTLGQLLNGIILFSLLSGTLR